MPDDLRWSWCNNNRNKVCNKCNALESSQNPPSPSPQSVEKLSSRKLVPGAIKVREHWSRPHIPNMRPKSWQHQPHPGAMGVLWSTQTYSIRNSNQTSRWFCRLFELERHWPTWGSPWTVRGSLNLTWAETQKLTFGEKRQLSWSPAAQEGSDLPEVTQEAAVAYRPHSHTRALQHF